jgi:hypothetical protein
MIHVHFVDYVVCKVAIVSLDTSADAAEENESALTYLGIFGHWINGDLLVRTVLRNIGMPLPD